MRVPMMKAQHRRRTAQAIQYPSPVAGLVSSRSLSDAREPGQAQGAAVLTNFFPTATGAQLRRGCIKHAQIGDGTQSIVSMFAYVDGTNRHMFAATDTAIYDVTTPEAPTDFILVDDQGNTFASSDGDGIGNTSISSDNIYPGQTSGDWVACQFAATGTIYLRLVNGVDTPLVFSGSGWSTTPALTFPDDPETGDPSELDPNILNYVWQYKNRLYFIEKDSLNVWYLQVDQVGGELKLFPMGGIFQRGGSLMIGASWSLDSGQGGGLSEQCVMITTEGEVAVFQGSSPDDVQTWHNVGVYRIGEPLGKHAYIRSGADIIVATNVGFVPLSQAIKRDVAALSPAAASYPIEKAWTDAVDDRGKGWHCEIWPGWQMIVVAMPTSLRDGAGMFVANAQTGAWSMFTGWDARCMVVFNDFLYFGSDDGFIYSAMVTGADDERPYTGIYMPLFDDAGTPMSRKAGRMVKVELRSFSEVNEQVTCQYDFRTDISPVPPPAVVSGGNQWDVGEWNAATWDGAPDAIITQSRHSISGYGYRLSPILQISSASIAPSDVEIVSVEATFELADIFT